MARIFQLRALIECKISFCSIQMVLSFFFSVLMSLNLFGKENSFEEVFIEHLRPQIENQIRKHFSEILNSSNETQSNNKIEKLSESTETSKTTEISWVRFKLPDQVAKMDSHLAKKIILSPVKFEGKGVLVVQFEVSAKQFAFTAEYRILSEALVTTRAINSLEKINDSDVQIKKVDVTYLSDRTVKREEVIGRTLNRPQQVGQVIVFSDLKREPLVERGQMVKIKIYSDGLDIAATGISEQAGFLNDWIRVSNPETKKIILGQVVERGTVEIR